jgi:hypothetical protein
MSTGSPRDTAPKMKCFGCSSECKDFGFWTGNGRVHDWRCINKSCRFCGIPKDREDIPGLYSTKEWKTKQ